MAATVRAEAQRGSTFRSLRTRNYRLYFSGQLVSMAGTFMQTVAQGWLVLKLTGSTTALGLALAGIVISLVGVGPCFLVNAASFLGVIVSLLLMRPSEMHRVPAQPRAPRQLRDGFSFVRRTPEISSLLLMTAVFFGLVWTF